MAFIFKYTNICIFTNCWSVIALFRVGEYGSRSTLDSKEILLLVVFLSRGRVHLFLYSLQGTHPELADLDPLSSTLFWIIPPGVFDGFFLPDWYWLDQNLISWFGSLGLGCKWEHISDRISVNCDLISSRRISYRFSARWSVLSWCLDHLPVPDSLMFPG